MIHHNLRKRLQFGFLEEVVLGKLSVAVLRIPNHPFHPANV